MTTLTVKQLKAILADKPDEMLIALNGYKGDFYHIDLKVSVKPSQDYGDGPIKFVEEEDKRVPIVNVLYIEKTDNG